MWLFVSTDIFEQLLLILVKIWKLLEAPCGTDEKEITTRLFILF